MASSVCRVQRQSSGVMNQYVGHAHAAPLRRLAASHAALVIAGITVERWLPNRTARVC